MNMPLWSQINWDWPSTFVWSLFHSHFDPCMCAQSAWRIHLKHFRNVIFLTKGDSYKICSSFFYLFDNIFSSNLCMLHLQGDYCKILESQWPPQLPVYGTDKYYPLFFHQKTVRLSYPWKRDTSVVLSHYTSEEEKMSFVSRI